MALYVRVQTSFWNHRKTLRLRSCLGDDALWIVPRLWSYAAENQPDGDFTAYSATELGMLLGYTKHPQAMLEALQQAGFMDGMKIHDWQEHNGYHKTFATRAKKAAKARWGKEKKGIEKKGLETSIATSIPKASKAKSSVEEIKIYCQELGLPTSDGDACFAKWEGNGWTNGGEKIKDWKATIRSWKLNGYLPSQKGINGHTPAPASSTQRPEWLPWLEVQGATNPEYRDPKFREYQYAPDFMKDEFHKEMKAKKNGAEHPTP